MFVTASQRRSERVVYSTGRDKTADQKDHGDSEQRYKGKDSVISHKVRERRFGTFVLSDWNREVGRNRRIRPSHTDDFKKGEDTSRLVIKTAKHKRYHVMPDTHDR